MRFACAVLAASIAFTQPSGHGVISGTVLDSTNAPVRKAIVTLTLQALALQTTPRAWATERTDDSGRFTFKGLPAGKYNLRAEKAGGGAATYGTDNPRGIAEPIALADGETRGGLTLRLIRSCEIAGRIVDDAGDPVANAAVQLLRAGRNLGERVVVPYREGATDDRGEYSLVDLAPGRYYLRAVKVPFSLFEVPVEDLAPQYHGGVRNWKDSTPVTLRSGASLNGLDFHLPVERLYPVRGRVTGVPSLPSAAGPGLQVSVGLAGDGPVWCCNAAGAQPPDYTFDLGAVPGDKYLVETLLSAGDKTWSASEAIDTSRPAGEILLTLAPALDIKGRLKIEGEMPQPPPAMQVTLNRRGGQSPNIAVGPGPDGTFTLRQVPAGEWAVAVNPMPQGGFLKSARLGDRDVRFTRFTVESGASLGPLNIVVSMNSAKVAGQVDAADGDSKRAGIILAPTGEYHNLARFYYAAAAGDDGKFKLQNVAPGKYRIFALEKLAPADFRNPEAADLLDPLGQESS